jgi:hypothetical protein
MDQKQSGKHASPEEINKAPATKPREVEIHDQLD